MTLLVLFGVKGHSAAHEENITGRKDPDNTNEIKNLKATQMIKLDQMMLKAEMDSGPW